MISSSDLPSERRLAAASPPVRQHGADDRGAQRGRNLFDIERRDVHGDDSPRPDHVGHEPPIRLVGDVPERQKGEIDQSESRRAVRESGASEPSTHVAI